MSGYADTVEVMGSNDERVYEHHLSLMTQTIASALQLTSIPCESWRVGQFAFQRIDLRER